VRTVTHELVGVTLAIAAGHVAGASGSELAGLAAGAFVGSLLPDVDHPRARVHRRTRLERRSPLVRLLVAPVRLALRAVGALGPHRGITHSAAACAAVAVLLALAASAAGAAAATLAAAGAGIGYTAHVLADACTPGGVLLWAPLSRRPAWVLPRGARIRTGSLRELAFVALVAAALAALVWS